MSSLCVCVGLCSPIYALPQSPTCGRSSLNTASAGPLPGSALDKSAKESKHTHLSYTQTHCMVENTMEQGWIIHLTFIRLSVWRSHHKQSKLTMSTAICDPRVLVMPRLFTSSLSSLSCHFPLSLSLSLYGMTFPSSYPSLCNSCPFFWPLFHYLLLPSLIPIFPPVSLPPIVFSAREAF